MVNRNSTHITFSWDIVDGYYNSSYINYFFLYKEDRSSFGWSLLYIPFSSTTSNGTTFSYTSSLDNFNNEPYIMWVEVHRRSHLYPTRTYSIRKYVKIGK